MSKGVPIPKVAKIPSLVNYPTSKMATIRTRCCDTGRPVMADPMTGTTICSCQLQTGIPAYLSRVPSLPETVYGTGTGHPFLTSAVVETASPFYQMYATERQTESRKTAPSAVQSAYYYDHVMATHPYGNFFPGFDLNGARRKNATRENTNALKAWLHQHRKNPYPTKGEKIMLAVMTQMTLTQVSTWFANARRRLKKDCKIDGKEVDLSDIESDETKDHNDSMASRLSDSESDVTATTNNLSTDLSDISDAEEQTTATKNKSIKKCVQRLFSPDRRDELFLDRISSPEVDTSVKINSEKVDQHGGVLKSTIENVTNQNQVSTISRDAVPTSDTRQTKRKIWSISEIIG